MARLGRAYPAALYRPKTRISQGAAQTASGVATTVTAGLSASATITRNADASATVTVGLTASATITRNAATSTSVTAGLTASADRTTVATGSTAVTAGLTAAAAQSMSGNASSVVTVGLTASASIGPSADAPLTVTTGLTASASVSRSAAGSAAITAGLTASASITTSANGSTAVTAGLTATASRATAAAASTAVTAGLTAAAGVSASVDSSLAVAVGLTASMTKNAGVGIGALLKRGQSPSMIIRGSDGAHAIAVYFGDVLVWDGTRPVRVQVPCANGSGVARPGEPLTGAIGVAVTASGSGTAFQPIPVVPALVVAPTANGSGSAPTPGVDVVAEVATPPALGFGIMPTPGVLVTDDAIAIHVTARGSGVAPAPTAVVDAVVEVPPAMGSGLAPAPVGGVSTTAVVPTALGSGLAPTPTPEAAVSIAVPTALGSGVAPVANPSAAATITAVPATGSGLAPAPTPVITVTEPTAYPVRVPTNGTAHGMRGNTNGAYTVNYPAGSVSGDLIILYVTAYRNNATAATLPPDGTWNTKYVDNALASGNYAACYWRFRGAETSVTITPSSNIGTAGQLWSIEVQMQAYQAASVDATNPVPLHSFYSEPASGTTITTPATITTGPYVELLGFFSAVRGGSTAAFTTTWGAGPAELTDLGGSMVSPTNYMGISTAYAGILTAGSSGTTTVTPSVATVFRRVTALAIAPVGTVTPAAPTQISTDFGSTAGALDSNWSTFGATPPIHVDSRGFASGVGTCSTPMSRAKWTSDFPAQDDEVWAILADVASLHSASAVTGRISANNQRGIEFTITSTLVAINSFFDGTERFNGSPAEGTGWKVRTPYGSSSPYGGGGGTTPYPELAAALVVGARISARFIGTTVSGYIDPPGSTYSGNMFVTKDIPDIALSQRPGFLMQDDSLATSASPGMQASNGAAPPAFSSWGVIAL